MTVSRRTLRRLAGAVWLAVGAMLVYRGAGMLVLARTAPEEASRLAVIVSLILGLALGGLKGRYVISRSARRNVKRIEGLAAPRAWNVFSGRMALLILLMIGLGLLLRLGARHGWLGGHTVVGGIYVGIGAALLVSAFVYFAPKRPALPTRSDTPPSPREAPTGVLLVNLGTPDEPTPAAVRQYLREFLSDPRVIEVNRVLWAFVLNVIILPFRSRASARAYREVWTEDGSPLLHHTRVAGERLAERLGQSHEVVVGMRYGNPSLARALDELIAAGCERIVALPLFPQFSNTTTGSVQAELGRLVGLRRAQPALEVRPPFHSQPDYVEALAALVREARGDRGVDFHVFSFHGLPEAYVERGDPYVEHCTRTAWALATSLGLERDEWELVFQSRFGDEPWLQPYADEFVPALAPERGRVLVALPGFAADCLETLEEIGIRLRRDFLAAGGRELVVVPALNAHPRWIDALETIVVGPR